MYTYSQQNCCMSKRCIYTDLQKKIHQLASKKTTSLFKKLHHTKTESLLKNLSKITQKVSTGYAHLLPG